MVQPFLKRLFRYRQSEARTPTEDFLSEVLADFLRRAPQGVAEQILQDCFVPPEMAAAFGLLTGGESFDIRTQVRLPSGKILDILVELSGRPVLVIENKIGAAFQRHTRTDNETEEQNSEQEAEENHQLVTYGAWLRNARRPEGWPGVLTVLTHAVLAPPDFNPANSGLYGAVPHQCYWRGIHARLRTLVGNDDSDRNTPAWTFVGRELCRFLESEEMSSMDLTSVEIAALNVAMEPARRSAAAFAETGAEVLHRYPNDLVSRAG